ncbi:MAG: phosphoribosylformylglycinamidine synthase subunit PurL [Candidatus Krumholzibacteria bacterium]|jgi:phosphoribosylformylglycinamidine synthase|nr:phosphoribosylformylglycinamidine synthase subunit PurL [Candidatus Krumholzibacteria bacterium]MDP6797565.1 phosphoribosylformylglycinamidine synthase subunit PurL [Candidatus Krumholzibacteria bacterium]
MQAVIEITSLSDSRLLEVLSEHTLSLKPSEARRVAELLGREPTLTELTLFNTMWSEHCSYKSSRKLLKEHLPTEGPDVVLGPVEDSGIVRLGEADGKKWCVAMSHESHNHPSQVLPFEGAATGIGGIVRDVYCMGAEVIGVLDPLRMGDPRGANGERSREILSGVVDGIWHYGNALGVPNLGGDLVFHPGYDDNCLVNVVALGLLPEDGVIRSRVPEQAREEPYDFILVGKPTDESGFGGAAFASVILDEEEENRGAVQVPDPFLKRVLSEANRAVLRLAEEEGFAIGFKDLGAGGIACVSSELAEAGGFGMRVDLEKVPVSDSSLPGHVIACSETQERYGLAVPRRVSDRVLKIYNEDYDLPHVYRGAYARVVGEVTEETRYVLLRGEEVLCDAEVEVVTSGIRYDREEKLELPERKLPEPAPFDAGRDLLALLSDPNLCDRSYLYQHYDQEVKGHALLRPGEADAGLIAPFRDRPLGMAVTCDGNPWYGAADPRRGAELAVCEAVRNLACVGAWPLALTDCLNYGNPEKPGPFAAFAEGVRGIGEACRRIGRMAADDCEDSPSHPIPVISGNVSFYNESAQGRAIPPSPIVGLVGRVDDVSLVQGLSLKSAGNPVYLLGERQEELGASAWHRVLFGVQGGELPEPDYERLRRECLAVIEAISSGMVAAAHDISEGGLAVAAVEMMLGRRGGRSRGLSLNLRGELRAPAQLFSETGGFLVEVETDRAGEFEDLLKSRFLEVNRLGEVQEEARLRISCKGEEILALGHEELSRAWRSTLPSLFPAGEETHV